MCQAMNRSPLIQPESPKAPMKAFLSLGTTQNAIEQKRKSSFNRLALGFVSLLAESHLKVRDKLKPSGSSSEQSGEHNRVAVEVQPSGPSQG